VAAQVYIVNTIVPQQDHFSFFANISFIGSHLASGALCSPASPKPTAPIQAPLWAQWTLTALDGHVVGDAGELRQPFRR